MASTCWCLLVLAIAASIHWLQESQWSCFSCPVHSALISLLDCVCDHYSRRRRRRRLLLLLQEPRNLSSVTCRQVNGIVRRCRAGAVNRLLLDASCRIPTHAHTQTDRQIGRTMQTDGQRLKSSQTYDRLLYG